MKATVIPFPLSARSAFVRRHAEILNCMTPQSAERATSPINSKSNTKHLSGAALPPNASNAK
jgi:hypothetical protein